VSDDERPEIFVDFTPDELAAVEAAAARAGLSPEAWIIRTVNRGMWRDRIARRFGMNAQRGWWWWPR
jgi:hypothetical protein